MIDLYFPLSGHTRMVCALELVLHEMFRNMGLNAKAHCFFEDDESLFEFTVYGVRVACDEMSDSEWAGFISAISSFCLAQYGEMPVVVEED